MVMWGKTGFAVKETRVVLFPTCLKDALHHSLSKLLLVEKLLSLLFYDGFLSVGLLTDGKGVL